MKNNPKPLNIIYILAIAGISFLITAEPVSAYWIWTPQTKKWINPKYAPKDTPKEQLLYALDFFEAADYKKALGEFRKIINYYRKSESASEAQYYVGRCYDKLNKPYAAFEAYQKVIDDYPFTQRVDEIIERQFDIGERLYQGEKTKFLGLAFKAMPEQIIDIYKKVVSSAPYSRFAPVAQFRIGELYKKMEFYEEAREAFQKILEDYPDSDVATEAKFQVAVCASCAAGRNDYDQKFTSKAIEEFEEFAKENPDSELVKKANAERVKLIEKQAGAYLKIAKFYERIGRYKAASIYYNKILDGFETSSMAPVALEGLKVMEKKIEAKR